MRCIEVRVLRSEGAALDAATDAAVAAHIARCPACVAALADEQLMLSQLRAMPIHEPPVGLESRLLALPSAASIGLAPLLAERWVWLLLAAATAVTSWGLWRAQVDGANDRIPAGTSPLVDAGAPGERGGADPSSDVRLALAPRSDAIATAVLRLRPVDLRRQPALDAATDADTDSIARPATGATSPGRSPGRSSPPGREPRDRGAGITSNPPEDDGGAGVPRAPSGTPTTEARPAHRPHVATAQPTALVAAATATVGRGECTGAPVTLTVRVFADVAGDGACAGCDGAFDGRDRDALAASGAAMPALQIGYYSQAQPDALVFEQTIEAADAHYISRGELIVELPVCVAADQWPLVAIVRILGDGATREGDWTYCPTSGGEAVLSEADNLSFEVRIHPMCPIPTPTPPSAPLGGSPTPDATPVDAPSAGGPEPPLSQVGP
ncbi:MAG: hypothetical protein ABI780_00080 [Ardenticatenales bacterium]